MNSESIGAQLAVAGEKPSHATITVKRTGCFLELKYRLTSAAGAAHLHPMGVAELIGKTRWSLPRLIHVPSIWARPDRSYPSASVNTGEFPGIFHDYVASILLNWQEVKKEKVEELDAN